MTAIFWFTLFSLDLFTEAFENSFIRNGAFFTNENTKRLKKIKAKKKNNLHDRSAEAVVKEKINVRFVRKSPVRSDLS